MHGIIDSMDMSLSKLQEIVRDRKAWALERGRERKVDPCGLHMVTPTVVVFSRSVVSDSL